MLEGSSKSHMGPHRWNRTRDRANLFTRVFIGLRNAKSAGCATGQDRGPSAPASASRGPDEMAQAGMKTVPAALKTLASIRVSTLAAVPFEST